MKNFWKKILIPSGEAVALEAHDTWEVRWYSMGRIGDSGSASSKERVEVFPDQRSAVAFARELEAAGRLLNDFEGHIYMGANRWGPYVSKNKYKGRKS